jgi:hypothetical protein
MSKTLQELWQIRVNGPPPIDLGIVEAHDAEAAIKEAIKQFNITNREQQKRLMAQRRT